MASRGRVPRALLVWIGLLVLPGLPAAGAQEPAPFRIDSPRIALVETGAPEGCAVRQPIWSPPGSPNRALALQVYMLERFSGVAIVDDVPAQMATARAKATRRFPMLSWVSPAALSAQLWPGSWFLGAYDEQSHQDFLYSANAEGNGTKARYTSRTRSIYLGGDLICRGGKSDVVFPTHAYGSQMIACQLGPLGQPGDIAIFTPLAPTPENLTHTTDIAETLPARCPNADIVAYLEQRPGDPGPALNLLAVTVNANGPSTAERQFTDGDQMSRARLGVVDAFAWCPRLFGNADQGYALIAYYRRREARSAESTEIRHDLCVVPVSLRRKRLLIDQMVQVAQDVAVELGQIDPTPPAWHPGGEYLFYLEFLPGRNPLRVARIPQTSNLAAMRNSISTWPLAVWPADNPPVNLAVSCSGDGQYLALIGAGRSPQNPEIYYNDAYVIPLLPR